MYLLLLLFAHITIFAAELPGNCFLENGGALDNAIPTLKQLCLNAIVNVSTASETEVMERLKYFQTILPHDLMKELGDILIPELYKHQKMVATESSDQSYIADAAMYKGIEFSSYRIAIVRNPSNTLLAYYCSTRDHALFITNQQNDKLLRSFDIPQTYSPSCLWWLPQNENHPEMILAQNTHGTLYRIDIPPVITWLQQYLNKNNSDD